MSSQAKLNFSFEHCAKAFTYILQMLLICFAFLSLIEQTQVTSGAASPLFQGPLVLFMGTGYDKKPWVTRGEGSEAQEAFEEHSHEMLLGGITISLKGYKEKLY